MGDLELSTYDMNKQLIAQQEPVGEPVLLETFGEVSKWMYQQRDSYFMLLCHERRDYTIIHLTFLNSSTDQAAQEIWETLENRGAIVDALYIDDGNNAYEFWVRDESGENYFYALFPYDLGVIEVQ